MKAIVCGAGIAGLTASWWLARDGWDVLLVERAPGPREEGYMIDFFGSGYDVAERMGLLPRLAEIACDVPGAIWVNDRGHAQADLDYELFRRMQKGRAYSLMRGDLERVLYEALPASVEQRFGCSVAEIQSSPNGVDVVLTGGETVRADLLIGADGVHSRVRELTFGPEAQFFRYLGYHTAAYIFESRIIENALRGYVMIQSVPRRQVGLYVLRSGHIAAFFVHAQREPVLPVSPRETLKRVYAGMNWLVPETLKAADLVRGLYYDQVAQIEMPHWHKGRVAVLGDAAYAVSLLAGHGASLAMGGAYVLAEELRKAPSVEAGLAQYETRLKPLIAKKQAAGRRAAQWIAPLNRRQIWMRNASLKLAKIPGLSRLLAPVLSAGAESVVTD